MQDNGYGNSIVRISNVLNLTRQEFTAVEKHIFLYTILHLKEHQGFGVEIKEDFVLSVEFSAAELKETNRERIKEALDKITSKKIYFDQSSKGREYYGYVVPFVSAKYDSKPRVESLIKVKLNPDCQKLFLELANGYTIMDLKAIINLKSVHSIRMYELISQHLNQGSWTIDLGELKNLLGLEYAQYSRFPDFKRYILEYSQRELWEHCNLHFEWEIAAKQRKKITALTFHIKERNKQERTELNEEIKATQNFIKSLSPADVSQKASRVKEKYNLTKKQFDYVLSNTEVFNEFIRVDLIIEDMIAKGKPPRDRTKYLAKSLKLDQVKFNKK